MISTNSSTVQTSAAGAMTTKNLPDRSTLTTSARCFAGVVGLGHMGTAFALNLITDGHRVIAYDRDPAHVEALRAAGAEDASKLADLSACDVVLTSLPDDEALAAVALDPKGLVHIMRSGAVHISTSTVSPGLSRRLEAEHEARGQAYVAAPVLGNPDLALSRQLFVLAAGRSAALEQTRPLLERLGQRLFVVGEEAAAANLMKLAGNVLTATTLQCMGEVLALLRKGGIDRHLAFDILTNSLFDSKVHRTYGGKIVDERYSPAGMAVPLAIKDLRLALAEAEHEAVPMPAASLVRDRLVGLVAHGWADPSVPMMMRHLPPGSLDPKARKDSLIHAHAAPKE
jgi:3-hydroxyisobutyrate dehydrogenase-like beta-hydroxyacid dehydrogenase